MGRKLSIPTHLSPVEWDKHKTIFGKIAKKETGITAALRTFIDTYTRWGWGRIDDSSLVNYFRALQKDPENYAELLNGLQSCRNCEEYLARVQQKLNIVKTKAGDTAREFKANRLVPSSARQFLEGMAKACDTFVPAVRKEIADSERKIVAELTKAHVKF